MIYFGIAVILLMLVAVYFGGGVHEEVVDWWQQRTVEKVQAGLRAAESAVDGQYRQARREMNDAAGQSWRNLADGDRG